jgi:hypothetical protein
MAKVLSRFQLITTLIKKLRLQRVASHKPDVIVSTIIFVLVLVLFLFSRVHQLADSNYSMLLSQSLLHHHSFTLDNYNLPRLKPTQLLFHVSVGNLYQLEYIDDHIYYFWPPGSSILSLPFVALMNAVGISATNTDGSYNPRGEITIQAALAALLMALLASIFYFTSRLFLSPGWSAALLALSAALGTQIWSTASRALWAETWGIFLLGIVVLMLVAQELGRYALRPALLATLLAWTYFVRPTFSVPIMALTIYILLYYRRLFLLYAAVGAAWLAVFVGYSWYHFHQILPNYFLVYQHFGVDTLWMAFLGNLISPSRGLLVFVPMLFLVGYFLIRYWRQVPLKKLAVLSFIIVLTHLIVVSSHSPWYGGHCFGPRYSTGIVPWLFLLGVLAMRGWRTAHTNARLNSPGFRRRTEASVGLVLLFLSVTINALGATERATWMWNVRPVNVDLQPDRVWDWRHPQFLAKWDR